MVLFRRRERTAERREGEGEEEEESESESESEVVPSAQPASTIASAFSSISTHSPPSILSPLPSLSTATLKTSGPPFSPAAANTGWRASRTSWGRVILSPSP